MIFLTAYDTFACKGLNTQRIVQDVNQAMVTGYIRDIAQSIFVVQDGEFGSDTIAGFTHPLNISATNRGIGGKMLPALVFDARPFGKWDRSSLDFRVTNLMEYELLQLRARLNKIWMDDVAEDNEPVHIRDLSPMCLKIFADWLTIDVQRRFSLEPKHQYQLNILAGIFYYSLFTNREKFSEQDLMTASQYIARAMELSQPDVLEILEQIGSPIHGVEDYCKKAAEITGSLRLAEMTPAVLYAAVGGSWFGANAKEILHAAIEHPPTWVALVYRALDERGFQRTGLGKLANSPAYANKKDNFKRAMVLLVNDRAPLQ